MKQDVVPRDEPFMPHERVPIEKSLPGLGWRVSWVWPRADLKGDYAWWADAHYSGYVHHDGDQPNYAYRSSGRTAALARQAVIAACRTDKDWPLILSDSRSTA